MRNILKKIREFSDSPNGPMLIVGSIVGILLLLALALGSITESATADSGPKQTIRKATSHDSGADGPNTTALDAAINLQMWNP